MKKAFQELVDYFKQKGINKRQWGFYLVVMIATVLVELSISSGTAPCVFPLIMLAVLFVFLKYIFPAKPEE